MAVVEIAWERGALPAADATDVGPVGWTDQIDRSTKLLGKRPGMVKDHVLD